MAQSPKMLFLHSGSWCYDSNLYFEERICAEFEKFGWQIERVSCPRENAVSVLNSLYGKRYSVIFDINSILPGLKDEDRTYCIDHISGQVWHYILDHPLYHHDVLKCPLNDFHVICLDEKHAAFIRKYYPHIRQVTCLPLAAEQAQRQILYHERAHEVLFTGTYTDPDAVLYQVMKQPKEKITVFEQTVQLLLDQPELTQEEALFRYTDGKDLPRTLQEHYRIDMFLHACLREELLAWFLKKKIPVTVYGHNWGDFLEKCKKSIPNAERYLRIMGEVSYEKMPEIYANTKIALNQLPWFTAGMHDRIPLALMNGCVCVTDGNPYLEKQFLAKEELYFYPLKNMERAADIVREILQNPDIAAKTAAQGFSHAQKHLGWKNWTETLLSYMELQKL